MSNKLPIALDLKLPVFSTPQAEHWPAKIGWADAMRSFTEMRLAYMREHDSPEQRWREKNPARFRLP